MRFVEVAEKTSSVEALEDEQITLLQLEEGRCAEALGRQISQLRLRWRQHEERRRQLARELLRRKFTDSPFGRIDTEMLLPCLGAAEVLRWLCASPAAGAQLCGPYAGARIHHLRMVAAGLTVARARMVVRDLHWPSVRTIKVDLGSPGWECLIQALGEVGPRTASTPHLPGLHGLSVTFPAERSAASLQRWQAAAPLLARLGVLVADSPLQELVLTDLQSTDVLTSALASCSRHLQVCQASFIGPKSRKRPLELPSSGLPALQCLMVRHRDFCEQRSSRQDRMRVHALPLLTCLQSIRQPEKLRVLALAGICIDGGRRDTAELLRGLQAFRGLVAVALRFSVPSTFGTLLPLASLIRLRCAWPCVGHFTLGDTSLHGFDYWPEQMTHFQQCYPHGGVPEPFEVFKNEFHQVLVAQYNTTAEAEWACLDSKQKGFWADVGQLLPEMPHSEVRRRIAGLFPSGL